MDLVEALDADEGTVCAVGAGGKKTTLYALAARLGRAVVTATVPVPGFDAEVGEVVVTDDPVSAVADADGGGAWPLGLVVRRDGSDGYRGYDAETVDALSDATDAPILVLADVPRVVLTRMVADDPVVAVVDA